MIPLDWRTVGARIGALDEITVLLLIGDSPVALAAAARGVAGNATASRRVAVFDLAGGFGQFEPDGLITAFKQGRSLNALARPLGDGSPEHFVVPRGPGSLDETLTTHDRWPKLVDGFRQARALLVITLPTGVDGTPQLAARADKALQLFERTDGPLVNTYLPPPPPIPEGDVAPAPAPKVERPSESAAPPPPPTPPPATPATPATPPSSAPPPSRPPRSAPTVVTSASDTIHDDPTLEIPPLRPSTAAPRPTPRTPGGTPIVVIPRGEKTSRPVLMAAVVVVVLLAGAAGAWQLRGRLPSTPPLVAEHAESLAAMDARPLVLPDTLDVPTVVNPSDSARAALWSVELVATNDRADANLRLAERRSVLAGTISPVWLGGDSAPWYKIVVGAFVDRTAAELQRRALRQVGMIDADAGVVARVPFAFRLETGLHPDSAKARANALVRRGIAAYALVDDRDRATVYTGAFASPEQSVLLLAELRSAGLTPDLAFRVGRTY